MHAVLLAGGRGTRLHPLTLNVPKPMLPLGGRPIIEVMVRQLARCGVGGLSVCLNHQADVVQRFLGDGSRWDVTISCAVEESPLGTAGGLRNLADLPDDFLVINSDTLTNLDYRAFFEKHRREEAWASVFTPWIETQIDYGVVTLDCSNGRLTGYDEKPKRGYHVSSGVYVLSKRLLAYLPPRGPVDMPDLIRAAMDDGRKVLGFECDAYWRDIGTIEQYRAAAEDFCACPERFVRA